jgi:hypothetical protein
MLTDRVVIVSRQDRMNKLPRIVLAEPVIHGVLKDRLE